jgi:hypothetical protein
MRLAFSSFLPRSFYSPLRINWKKLWIPFWVTASVFSINNSYSLASAFTQPPKLKGYTYNPKRSHNQLSLPTANSFFVRTVDDIMAPSPRSTRSSTRSSSSINSTPLDDQEVAKKEKKRKATSPVKEMAPSKFKASPKAASPVKEKSPSKVKASPIKAKSPPKVKGSSKQAPDDTDSDAAPEAVSPKKAKKTPAAPKHQVLTERDEIPKLWDSDKAKQNGSYSKSSRSIHSSPLFLYRC